MRTFTSEKQKELFALLESSGELVFACGPKGAVANLVGHFKVRKSHHNEDQLDVGDGTCHVHIDWSRVKRFEVGEFHGEGMLTFYDGDEYLFRFYRMEGPFSEAIHRMSESTLI
ncbi:hypothetical protein D3C87_1357960 [compost metagenome]